MAVNAGVEARCGCSHNPDLAPPGILPLHLRAEPLPAPAALARMHFWGGI